ncbi:MAG TPA: glycosyltransferase family 4 protein, partial [Solirubrobacteraceae bacterium]
MPFAIAQVSPHPWEARTELGRHIEALAGELARRGHRVVIVAPSLSPRASSAARRALRDARDDPASLLGEGGGEPSLFLAGEVLPGSRRGAGLPVDVARSVEELLALVPLDFVHVHEPFTPSTPSAALRHSRALNVGSFHAPAERVLSTQVARRFVELFFGRLDARIASYEATAALMNAHFPADYRVIAPAIETASGRPREGDGPLRIAFVAGEERAALRVLLRALRRLGEDVDWRAQVVAPASSSVSLSAQLRARVEFVTDEAPAAAAIAASDVTVLASAGAIPAPGLALEAIGAGSVPIASR